MSISSRRKPRVLIPVLLTVTFVLLSLVTGRTASPEQHVQTRMPTKTLTIVPGTTPAELTLGTAREFYRRAPVVVVTSPDPPASRLAARTAARLRLPLLSAGPALPGELKQLHTARAIVFGDVTATALGRAMRVSATDLTAAPPHRQSTRLSSLARLATIRPR